MVCLRTSAIPDACNDATNGWETLCCMFADDIKFIGRANGGFIQKDLDDVCQWSTRWYLPPNLSKCLWFMEGEVSPTGHMGPLGH